MENELGLIDYIVYKLKGIFKCNKENSTNKDVDKDSSNCSKPQEDIKVIYTVSWNCRSGEYYTDVSRASRVFLTKESAIKFKETLLKAQKILANTNAIDIRITETLNSDVII